MTLNNFNHLVYKVTSIPSWKLLNGEKPITVKQPEANDPSEALTERLARDFAKSVHEAKSYYQKHTPAVMEKQKEWNTEKDKRSSSKKKEIQWDKVEQENIETAKQSSNKKKSGLSKRLTEDADKEKKTRQFLQIISVIF